MKTIQQFIKEFYNEEDIFYIGLKNHDTGAWNNFSHNKKSFNEKFKTFYGLNLNRNVSIYATLNTFKNSFKGRYEENIDKVKYLFFDIDNDALKIKNEIEDKIGKATYVIQTSSEKYQLLYKLNDNDNFDNLEIKEISEILSNHFDTDKTFDLNRVFRLPFFYNRKNGFKVKIEKNDTLYSVKHFKNYIQNNSLKLEKNSSATKKISGKMKIPNFNFNSENIFYDKYIQFVNKKNGDNSRADLAFCIYLVGVKKISIDNAIKNLLEVREDMNLKHGYHLEHYLSDTKNMIKKSFNSNNYKQRR